MTKLPVIAVFDIGKTNKKLFLFDQHYQLLWEKATSLPETVDDDEYPCEDVQLLTNWMKYVLRLALEEKEFEVKAVNFSGYGASLVHVDASGQPVAPLYNYLKPYPVTLQQQLHNQYGGQQPFAMETASPALGHLNSGLQLYWLRQQRPTVFEKITWSLHLPQYLSFVFTGRACSDLTSIGCHTALWDFRTHQYHRWVVQEELTSKLAPIAPTQQTHAVNWQGKRLLAGVGIHDSSAALVPYLLSQAEPFVLLSTGTWSISLNPFSRSPLTVEDLEQDCLCYLSYKGKPVKASRLFAGHQYEEKVKQLSEHFHVEPAFFQKMPYNHHWAHEEARLTSPELAYHRFIKSLIEQQLHSTQLVAGDADVKRIFVDGGFSNNQVFMNLLAQSFPGREVFAANVAQASALGAALVVHQAWNKEPIPGHLVQARKYTGA